MANDRPKLPTDFEIQDGRARLQILLPAARTAAQAALEGHEGRDATWVAASLELLAANPGLTWDNLDALPFRRDMLRRRHVSLCLTGLPAGHPAAIEIPRAAKTEAEAMSQARELLLRVGAALLMAERGITQAAAPQDARAFRYGDLVVAVPADAVEDAAFLKIPGSDSPQGRTRIVANLAQGLRKILGTEAPAATWATLDETRKSRAIVVMATLLHLGTEAVDATSALGRAA